MTNMKAEKGDLIRVVNADDSGGKYENGDILEVSRRFREGADGVVATNDAQLFDYEYIIHRKAGEEDSEPIVPEDFGNSFVNLLTESDAVNPQHYKQGRVEVIDIIEDAVEGADPFEAVCQANVLKYALRYRHKNGVTDLRKMLWYGEKLVAYLDAKSTQDKTE